MQEARKPFVGIRFLLSGFNPPSHEQVRSKLLAGGGDESQDYTHLIVDNTNYDDPVCVSARNKAKTVVTGLWVDHSFDTGLAVDPASIMYQPPKDVNGIPGAKNLIVCLTGYQRQDRDDIMTMVRLIGAQFSKPLIANKVTHLICYKFEGEKYELARKMRRIKLVNHRWLEDCLKHWKLLPEEDYDKSGYELEMMEAEARDSEDDVADTSLKPSISRVTKQSPVITKSRSPQTCNLPKSTSELSTLPNVLDGFSTFQNAENAPVTPVSKNRLDTASGTYKGHASDPVAGLSERTPGSAEASMKVDSASGSVEKPSPSKLTAISYSRRTQRSPSSLSLAASKAHARSPTVQLGEISNVSISYSRRTQRSPSSLSLAASKAYARSPTVQLGETSNVSSAKVEDGKEQCGSGFEIPGRSAFVEKSDGKKQRTSAWKSSSEIDEMDRDRQACITGSSSVKLNGIPKLNFTNGVESPMAATNFRNNSSEAVNLREESPANGLPSSRNTTLESTGNQSVDIKLQSSFCESKESNSPCNQDSGNLHVDKSKPADLGNHHGGRDPSASKKASVLITLDTNQMQDEGLLPKQAKKHTGTKKVKRTVKKKGSINLGSSVVQEDMVTDSCRGNDRRDDTEKLPIAEDIENPLPIVAPVENVERELFIDLRTDLEDRCRIMDDDETEPPDERAVLVTEKESRETHHVEKHSAVSEAADAMGIPQKSISDGHGDRRKKRKGLGLPTSNSIRKKASTLNGDSSKAIETEETLCTVKAAENKSELNPSSRPNSKKKKLTKKRSQSSTEADMENNLVVELQGSGSKEELTMNNNQEAAEDKPTSAEREPMCFILSGTRPQKKEFQQVVRRLKGKSCRDSHQWSYQATHFIAPDPIRRTEKFFAASASGRWILKAEYLSACSQAGKFIPEEAYEWYKNGLNEDGAINLEAPRKWRVLRERTGHGAFYGMRVVIYGQCIAPPLDTLKRAVKAGDGTIVATSPPYNRFLTMGIDYAVVSPAIPSADAWVQQFLRHEIPCVAADYLVEYVCKSGYSLDKHVLYNTQKWAEKSFARLASKAEEMVNDC